jgi:hypothetical protein
LFCGGRDLVAQESGVTAANLNTQDGLAQRRRENKMGDEFIKVRSEYPPTVPLSHLELDLDRPVEGWPNFLGARAIAIVPDDLGRDSIPRQAARRLLDERREQELKQAALRRLAEQQAIEADQAFRASLPRGAAWYDVPPGVHPATAMLQAAKDAQPRRTPSQVEWMFGLQDTGGVIHEPFDGGAS